MFLAKFFRYLSQALVTPFVQQAEILAVLFTVNTTGSKVSQAVLLEVPRSRRSEPAIHSTKPSFPACHSEKRC